MSLFAASIIVFMNLIPSRNSRGCEFVEKRDKANNETGIGSESKTSSPVEHAAFLWEIFVFRNPQDLKNARMWISSPNSDNLIG